MTTEIKNGGGFVVVQLVVLASASIGHLSIVAMPIEVGTTNSLCQPRQNTILTEVRISE